MCNLQYRHHLILFHITTIKIVDYFTVTTIQHIKFALIYSKNYDFKFVH